MAIVGSAYVVVRAITDKLKSDVESSVQSLGGVGDNIGSQLGKNLHESFARETSNLGDGIDLTAAKNAIESDLTDGAQAGARAAEAEIEKMDIETPARAAGGKGGRGLGSEFAAGISGSGADGAISGLVLRIGALVPVIAIAVGALSSLVSGLFALASAVAPAIASLAVLPGILGALVQGVGGFALAFGGIGAAFKAGNKAMGGAGIAAASSAKAVANAQRRVADAARQNQDATEAAAKAVRDAQRGLSDAYQKASDAAISASRGLETAQRDLARAQREAAQAQKDVNQARIDAAESLQQLQFSTRGAAINEQQALIALQKARENLARFLELPVDNRMRKEAQLAADEAQLNYDRAKDKAADLKKENTAAQKAGVEGSSQVVKAKQNEADAQQRVVDATQGLKDAQDNVAKTQRDNARSIQDAQERLADALKKQSRTAEDNARRMADALQGVADAGKSAGRAANAYNTALKNLSPEAQKFVKYLLSIKPVLQDLRRQAGIELFPRLETAISTIIKSGLLTDLGKGLRESGKIMGDFAISVASLSNDPFFRGNFNATLKSNNTVLKTLTSAIAPLLSALFSLTKAAAPVTEEFANWIKLKAEAVAAYTGVGKGAADAAKSQAHLSAVIKDGAGVAKQLGRIFGNIGKALFDLGKTARPAGQQLLDAFEKVTKQWADFASNPDKQGMLKKYFDDVANNVRAIGRLAQSLGRSFARLGDDPSIQKVADILSTKVVPTLEGIIKNVNEKLGPQLTDTLNSVLDAFNSLSDSPAFQIVLGIFKAFADAIKVLATNPYARPALFALLSFLAAMKAIKLIGDFTGVNKLVGYYKKLRDFLNNGKLAKQAKEVADAANKTAAPAAPGVPASAAKGAGAAESAALGGAAAGAEKAAVTTEKSVGKLRGALNGLIPGFSLLSGPVLAVIAVVGVLVALFIGAYKHSDKLRKAFHDIGVALKPVIAAIGRFASKELKALGDWLAKVIEKGLELAKKAMPRIIEGFNKAKPVLEVVGKFIAAVAVVIFTKIIPAFIKFEVILAKVEYFIIKNIIVVLIKIITTVIKVGKAIYDFGAGVVKAFQDAADWVRKTVDNIVSFVQGIPGRISSFAGKLFDSITAAATALRDWVGARVTDIVNFYIGIGQRIAKGAGRVFGYITDAATAVRDWVGSRVTEIVSAATGISNRIQKGAGRIFGYITDAATAVRDWVGGRVTDIVSAATGIGNRIQRGAGRIFGYITDAATSVKDWVAGRVTDMVNNISGMKTRITTAATGMWDGIKSAFKGMLNAIIGWWNNLELKLPAIKIAGQQVSPAITIGTPNIPFLATGGTVAPTRGGTLAVLAEAGRPEQVTPLGPDGLTKGERAILSAVQGRGGDVKVYIDVHPAPGMNEAQIAAEVDRRLGWSLRTGTS